VIPVVSKVLILFAMPKFVSAQAVQPPHSTGVSVSGDCSECKRFSANYAEATKSYLTILTTIQLAYRENNAALVPEMETLKLAAQEKRGVARLELRRHEATHQTKAA
jgi:hypothetical protein